MSTPADRAMLLCRKLNIASVFFRNEIAEAICVAENEAWEAAVQAEREAKEKLRLVLHNTLCQEHDDCVEACIEARTAQEPEGEHGHRE